MKRRDAATPPSPRPCRLPNAVRRSRVSRGAPGVCLVSMAPASVAGEAGTRRLMQLIRAWSTQKHAHIQFDILNKQTLREAQKNPEKYRDLVVRIAGYCAYFVDLTPSQQEELIARTEHMN